MIILHHALPAPPVRPASLTAYARCVLMVHTVQQLPVCVWRVKLESTATALTSLCVLRVLLIVPRMRQVYLSVVIVLSAHMVPTVA